MLTPYFAEGIANREKVMTVMDGHLFDDHFRRLTVGGIQVQSAKESGHLCTYCTEETYLKGGSFGKDRMLSMLKAELEAIGKSGFTSLRTCGDMSWLLRNMPVAEEALAYESEVNRLLEFHDATFMCLYDANKVSGGMMRDILNTHSHVFMGTVVYENPYFIKPDDYRRTAMARRAATAELRIEESEP